MFVRIWNPLEDPFNLSSDLKNQIHDQNEEFIGVSKGLIQGIKPLDTPVNS